MKGQVRCIWMQRARGPPRFSLNELGIQCIGEPRYDFILHVEQIGNGLVETLGPQVISGFGIDDLLMNSRRDTDGLVCAEGIMGGVEAMLTRGALPEQERQWR